MRKQHPGNYIRNFVIPKNISVTEAAELLGVGRPTLSNLLNGKAGLSTEMALRIAKTFKVDVGDLLKIRNNFDINEVKNTGSEIMSRKVVPTFLRVRAIDIDGWANQITARHTLSVLVRKLIHSTCDDITHVDFPGYELAEKTGNDGELSTYAGNAWVPKGDSIWELGTSDNPKTKANKDYQSRIKSISEASRMNKTFVFVTPRIWKDKNEWLQEKLQNSAFKDVRVYDANDLEQWIEQSIPVQSWFSEFLNISNKGIISLEEFWRRWSNVTTPHLNQSIFNYHIKIHLDTLLTWLNSKQNELLIIRADSVSEGVAFVCAAAENERLRPHKDNFLVISDQSSCKILIPFPTEIIPVITTTEAEKEIFASTGSNKMILIKPTNFDDTVSQITLDTMDRESFNETLLSLGIHTSMLHEVESDTGRSISLLRRRYSESPAIKRPNWVEGVGNPQIVLAMTLVGRWHDNNAAEKKAICELAGSNEAELNLWFQKLSHVDETPVWMIDELRGITSKTETLYLFRQFVDVNLIENFFNLTREILMEEDPALQLPAEQRFMANILNKKRIYSNTMRQSVVETLLVLEKQGNSIGDKKLALKSKILNLYDDLFTGLTSNRLVSMSSTLSILAETAPKKFLDRIKQDLNSNSSAVLEVLVSEATKIGISHRAEILFSLESLAWESEHFFEVTQILTQMSQKALNDNWSNKPINSLNKLFSIDIPQTFATDSVRSRAFTKIAHEYPRIAWEIAIAQITGDSKYHMLNSYFRRTPSREELNEAIQRRNQFETTRLFLDFCIDYKEQSAEKLISLLEIFPSLSATHQDSIVSRIEDWRSKATLDDLLQIRQCLQKLKGDLTRNGDSLQTAIGKIKEMLASFTTSNPAIDNEWLFRQFWIEPITEKDINDWKGYDEKLLNLRKSILVDIYSKLKFDGLLIILKNTQCAFQIGYLLADLLIEQDIDNLVELMCIGHGSISEQILTTTVTGLLANLSNNRFADIIHLVTTKWATFDNEKFIKLLIILPLSHSIIDLVANQPEEIQIRYWLGIEPNQFVQADLASNIIDNFLLVKRGIAALKFAHRHLENLNPSQIYQILFLAGTTRDVEGNLLNGHSHLIMETLSKLTPTKDISDTDIANLELLHVEILRQSGHPFDFLKKEIQKSPKSFFEIVEFAYPAQLRSDKMQSVSEEAYHKVLIQKRNAAKILDVVKYFPGRAKDGSCDRAQMKTWIHEFLNCSTLPEFTSIGESQVGKILSHFPIGHDGNWPCEGVREILEDLNSHIIGESFVAEKYNSRGSHIRNHLDGGKQEFDIATKYKNWGNAVAEDYPFVAHLLTRLESWYLHDGRVEDIQASLTKKLR